MRYPLLPTRYNPSPTVGLSRRDFHKVAEHGFGDPNNAYAHSMAWFKDHLFVGTSRANMCLLQQRNRNLVFAYPPVDCPHLINSPEFEETQARAEIWRYNPITAEWRRLHQAPLILDKEGHRISRDLSFRGMTVYEDAQGESLLVTTWARPLGEGPFVLRSRDGETFEAIADFREMGLLVNSMRALTSFKGRLFTAPSGAFNNNPNTSGVPVIYVADCPEGPWQPANAPGFGDSGNLSVIELRVFGDYLYAGTLNHSGFQVWRSRCEGKAPFGDWECILRHGAGRGSLNQVAMTMCVFKDALYLGSGIQNGGYDAGRGIGPAGAEVLRIWPDGRWDLMVGDTRQHDGASIRPASGLQAGFGDLTNGYLWRMAVHEGWLYAGTFNSSLYLQWLDQSSKSGRSRYLVEKIGPERIVSQQAGFDLWRTADGENWLPVDRHGFGNMYNYGVRTFASTPHGLFLGTANPFGGRVAKRDEQGWHFEDNPHGGLEVWLGSHGDQP